jgi:hypothetical protein
MLTTTDLHATLDDPRHGGWGYACCSLLSDSVRDRLDRAIVAVANELGLTHAELFTWSNSKHGRWLADSLGDSSPTRATVRLELSREIIDSLTAEEAMYA